MGVLGWTPQQWCFSCLATNLKTCSLVEAKWWLAFRLDLLFLFVFHTYIQTLLHKWKFTLFFEQLPLLLPFQRDKLKLKDLLHSHMAVSEILENPIPMDSLTFPSFCNAIEVSSSYKELLAAFSSFFLKTLNLQSFFLVIMENSTSGRKWATGGGKELLFSYPQALKKLCQQGLICSWDLTVVAIKKEKNPSGTAGQKHFWARGRRVGFCGGKWGVGFSLLQWRGWQHFSPSDSVWTSEGQPGRRIISSL